MKKSLILRAVLFVLFLGAPGAFAQNCKLVSAEGLKGEELKVVAVDPRSRDVMFVGTQRGLYHRDTKSKIWSVVEFPGGVGAVNQILFGPAKNEVYTATDEGLYLLNSESKEAIKLFDRSNELEKKCSSVCISKDNYIFAGTGSGLFVKKKDEWIKLGAPFSDKGIISLFCSQDIVYAAIDSGVYKSHDHGKSWEQIYNIYSSEGVDDPQGIVDDPADVRDGSELSLRHITGLEDNSSLLYIATGSGVFLTKNGGQTWTALPLAGLDALDLRFLLADSKTKEIFAASKSGAYRCKDGQWQLFFPGYNCRYLAAKDGLLYVITDRDIFECSGFRAGADVDTQEDDAAVYLFKNEPTVQEVHGMAIEYAEVSNQKIKDWRRRAAGKAFLPQVSIGVDRNTTDLWHWEGGSTTKTDDDVLRRGNDSIDWGVSLKWDLGEIIYNNAQTSIDTRSKLLVELRNDILSEVTRLYFERRKLQMEALSNYDLSKKAELDKKLRILELTALIDRLTGGNFSRFLKSSE
ncbi:MAG TPA: hypothetical protein DCL35_05590 [Candidatus Omnitrophica bacterium]|nr:hypothetical protein [Candidatus Omnitrophota bacterium]